MGTIGARNFVLSIASAALIAGCGSQEGVGTSEGAESLGQVSQALTCSNSIPRSNVNDFYGGSGFHPDVVQKNYFAVGARAKLSATKPACSGVYLGNGYYLSAGTCNYEVGDQIQFSLGSGSSYSVGSIVRQRSGSAYPKLNYSLVRLASSEIEIQNGVMRLAKRAPVAGEIIGALTQTGGSYFFAPGTVTALGKVPSDANWVNRISHRLDTPTGALGAPIIDANGYVVAIHSEDTCTGSGNNGAMRVDSILADLASLTNPNVVKELTEKMPCTGMTPPGNTTWEGAGVTDVIKVNISTAHCGFTSNPPLYFASLGGSYDHEIAISETAIYDRTPTGFRVNVQKAGLTPALANQAYWYINWQAYPQNYDDGHAYRCAGTTGSTSWTADGPNRIFQTVTVPSYCQVSPTAGTGRGLQVSIIGTSDHRRATGIFTTEQPDHSYRVFVQRSSGLTPATASGWGWSVNWQLSADGGAGRMEAAGRASGAWGDYSNGPTSNGIAMYVVTGVDWSFTPKYFATLQASGSLPAPDMTGVSAIYYPIGSGFEVFINGPGISAATANANNWTLNWAARP